MGDTERWVCECGDKKCDGWACIEDEEYYERD